MAFTAKDVKELRERTGCGMMDCKKALTETDGDFEKAIEYLREKGLAAATKKAGRIAADGMVFSTVDRENKVGVVVEVNSETDFVAKNEMFREFVADVAAVVAKENPATVEELLTKAMPNGDTVEAALQEKILVIGENLKIRRFVRYEGPCVAYIHAGGTHGVLVNFEVSDEVFAKPEFEAYGKDIAMQIAAANPTYLNKADVPAEVLEKEKEILTQQAINEGKPAAIAEKMVAGRIAKYYKENCLVEQAFVKDDKQSITAYTNATAKELGGDIKIVAFTRFEKGEGIEKKVDDFAAEVAAMSK
ncbi:MAG: elongation factor Ts [Oscillospiraceae bacterium]|nr:elongation factor Ts [Oscillospiraceae bacterium]MBQ6850970.1 elongation factor Ts [Oscillospiraceae bacterium]MBR6610109.1 elongation factor Ts [Oscillospiraceae bacterium]